MPRRQRLIGSTQTNQRGGEVHAEGPSGRKDGASESRRAGERGGVSQCGERGREGVDVGGLREECVCVCACARASSRDK